LIVVGLWQHVDAANGDIAIIVDPCYATEEVGVLTTVLGKLNLA
jgi:hypothetical protein